MKSQILNALSQSWIPDFSLFLSPEAEKEVLELLFELLEQEKSNFRSLLAKLQDYSSREALLKLPNDQLFEILELNVNENQLSQMLMQGLEWLKGGAASNAMSALFRK